MADSASESDSSSIDGGPIMMPPSPITREQMQKRIDSLQQQNRVLKVELETYKLKMKAMDEECKRLRETSVYIVSTYLPPCAIASRYLVPVRGKYAHRIKFPSGTKSKFNGHLVCFVDLF